MLMLAVMRYGYGLVLVVIIGRSLSKLGQIVKVFLGLFLKSCPAQSAAKIHLFPLVFGVYAGVNLVLGHYGALLLDDLALGRFQLLPMAIPAISVTYCR